MTWCIDIFISEFTKVMVKMSGDEIQSELILFVEGNNYLEIGKKINPSNMFRR